MAQPDRLTAAWDAPPDRMSVLLVDADRPPLPDLPGYGSGGTYPAAWVVVRRDGVAVGHLIVSLHDGPVSGAALEILIKERLADEAAPTPPRVPDHDLPPATVVVPTVFGRPGLLERCAAALAALDYPDFEVLFVDNRRSDDGAGAGAHAETGLTLSGEPADWRRVADHPRVRVVAQPRPGASAARNRGVEVARGEVIAFTDDDVAVDPGWLRALVNRLIAEPNAGCVTGLVVPAELETPAQVWFELAAGGGQQRYRPATYRLGPGRFRVHDLRSARDPFSLYALGDFGTGSNMAFRRRTLDSLGGFDEALGPGTRTLAGEDIELFLRVLFAGQDLAFEPAARVAHTHRRDELGLRVQLRGYGKGFTAMLASLVLRDRRHLVGLAGVLLPGLASLLRPAGRRGAAADPSGATPSGNAAAAGPAGRQAPPIAGLSRTRLRAMFAGPGSYLRSRRESRRWPQ